MPSDFLTGGTAVTLVYIVIWGVLQFVKSRQEKDSSESGPVKDLATVNDKLVHSITAEREENTRLRGRLEKAEQRIDELETKIDQERTAHAEELAALRKEFNDRITEMEARYKKGGDGA